MSAGTVEPTWRPRVVTVEGRYVAASNATLLAITDDGTRVVYKPDAGQRPLWDFDASTLPMREVLAYETSRRMGFDLIPETVMADGPFGPGSVQRHVEGDDDFDALALVQRADAALWPVAALDVITNNADRKLGHLLRSDTRLVAIDHGLTFHEDDKLRTVVWCFAGLPWPEAIRVAAGRMATSLREQPEPYRSALTRRELEALETRVASVIEGVHPTPPEDRPAMPWPPY